MRLIDVDEFRQIFGMAEDCGDCKQNTRKCQNDMVFTRMDICGWLDDMPTVDAVPVKHGEWIGVMTEEWCTFDECKCSVCGDVEYFNKGWKKFSYCPNCGAKMDEEVEE